MKKKSTSQSAFFNLRVLIGLFLALTGVSLLALGQFATAANPFRSGVRASSHARTTQAQPQYQIKTKSPISPLVPPMFDCSKIRQFGIDRMENFRAGAIMIHCGLAKGGDPETGLANSSAFSKLVRNLTAPLVYGSTDVDLVTGTETSPNITQSETFSTANPDDPNEVVVAYNDSRGLNANPLVISTVSVSNDGGTTFTRVTNASGQSPFPNTFGDPVVLYNKPTQTWFTVWLDGNAGCTLGGFKSTDPSDPDSWTHFCVHPSGGDDRESGWADNNPASPFFGNMYISWNDFNVGAGALVVSRSTDNGSTWSSAITVANTGTFIRNTQITGDMSGNGTIYIAGMDEGGGGFPHNDTNLIYKSTDGGATWSNTYTGTPFPGPGVTSAGYFACMFNDNNIGAYWRHEGWGEPAAFNDIVHLVYAQQGGAGDAGDVYYIRSTDGGVTFGTPLKLNTDATTRPQWQPNLSVSPTGTLLATWYDARESTDCVVGDENTPCYRMFSRKSNDNGQSWLPDDMLSDVVSPLPAQPDPGIVSVYVGDYDYGSAIATKHVTSWADGRVAINSQSQQDAFTDRDLVGFAVTTADPACGSLVVGTAPTVFTVDLSDPVDPATVDATDFTVNGTPADSAGLSNGDQTITFTFDTSPVISGENTMHIDAGAFNQASNNDPVLEFNCTFRFTEEQLAVTDTDPPVGGTFTPPAPGTYTYDVNWNVPVDPASVATTDLQMSGNAGASVTGVTVTNGNMTTEFTLNIAFGGSLTAEIAAGAITDADGNPSAEFSGNYTVEGCPPSQYVIAEGVDTIVPGDTDIGNHTDDGDTFVALPFSFQLYDQTFNGVNVSSNGRVDFVNANEPSGYLSACLPPPPNPSTGLPYDFTVFSVWTDQRTDIGLSGCASFPGGNCGIFTSVSGSAPNRIFNIEWRTVLFNDNDATQNHEVRLYENDPNLKFEVIIGTLNPLNADQPWVSGVQGDSGTGFFTQDFCIPAGGSPPTNVSRNYEIPPCASPSPTPTVPPASPTPTATATATATPSVTPSATPTVTPPHHPTPRPRPTPHPRPTP
jgi:hypothetical protein